MIFKNYTNNPHKISSNSSNAMMTLHSQNITRFENKYLHRTKFYKMLCLTLRSIAENYVKKSTLAIKIFLQILNRLPSPSGEKSLATALEKLYRLPNGCRFMPQTHC